jgi:transposase
VVRTVVGRIHRGRRPLPELPRETTVIEPPLADRTRPRCQVPKVRIAQDTTEGLDFVPASFVIREYVRPKYACPCCSEGVSQAPLPARPIEKGRAEPGLLAQVVTSKYADHLPLYRQEQIFRRYGVEVTRRTLAEWNGAVADLLQPIVRVGMKEQLFGSPWIQCDDTTLDVQLEVGHPKIRTGHMWVYRGGAGEGVYDFTWVRNRAGPLAMLKGYAGYLQADAAPAFDEIFTTYAPHVLEVGCWAHGRRYFKDAVLSAPVVVAAIITRIGALYGLEKAAKSWSVEQRFALRQQQARPILLKLFATFEELQSTVLPKSPLGEALRYALRNRQALQRYLDDGRLEIDNNGAERAIKPLVLGRKNWLFCGSEAAAHRAAVLLSLVQTCKHLDLDPFHYLRDVIDRVSTHPMSRLAELTPREWKRLHPEAPRRRAAA